MAISTLPETNIPIHCFKCKRQLTPEEIEPNPFPTPVKNRQEWRAYSFTCAGCGTMGKFQYHVKDGVKNDLLL